MDAQRIAQLVEIENRQYLEEAVTRGNGVVFLTAHIGNWEWLGAALSMTGFPMTSVIKRQPNDQHTRLLNEYRERVGIEIFARGTAELVGAAKAMKKGKILGFLADQDANLWLYSYEKGTRHAFDAIYHALREIAGIQHEDDFVARAQHIAAQQLGFELPTVVLERAWVDVLDVRALYAYCVFRSFFTA